MIGSRRPLFLLSATFTSVLMLALPGCSLPGIPILLPPAFTPAAGSYAAPQSVTLSDSTVGAAIFYTTDGSTPTPSSKAYSGPILVSNSTTIEAIAVLSGARSDVAEAYYSIAIPSAAPPDFTPPAGTYASQQNITLTDSAAGASIFYTTNGTTPTTSSTRYTAPIAVSASETIEAIATAPGYTQSAVATAAYTISVPATAAPTFSPPPGNYTSAQSIAILDATPGSDIFYTTNGTTPTTSSTPYTALIQVSASETIEAIATAPGYTQSPVAIGGYTIGPVTSTANEWTWMGGDDSSAVPAVYGTLGSPSSANTPGERAAPASFTDKNGDFWLFGGADIGNPYYLLGYLNDLWEFNPATAQWTWVTGSDTPDPPGNFGTQGVASPSNMPQARAGAAAWTDADGNFWIFGGSYQTSAQIDRGDLWKHDTSTSEWTWVGGSSNFSAPPIYGTRGVPSATNYPGARSDAVSCTDHSGNFYLFGGYSQAANFGANGYLNDLWEYTPSTNQWTWLTGSDTYSQPGVYGTQGAPEPGNTPGARIGHNCWTDLNGNIWIFGGDGYDSSANPDGYMELNDLWEFNTTTRLWTWMSGSSTRNSVGNFGTKGIPSTSNAPVSRDGANVWFDQKGNFWLFGGAAYNPARSGAPTIINDLWQYNPTTNEWTWMSGSGNYEDISNPGTLGVAAPGNVPGARDTPTTWVDSSGNLWLFGGFGYPDNYNAGYLSDLWRYQPY
jgi:N-acetylneuraminic acid mutarotase